MEAKYYVKKEYNGKILYKRYKCIEGWSADKSMCWQFSKQSALKIAEKEKAAIHPSQRNQYCFSIEKS